MKTSIFGSMPFIPGTHPGNLEPLWRYLPPVPEGVVSTWLQRNIPQGSWVLDPFGSSPRLSIEAARAGYRVLVTANNPITRFLLEMLSAPPSSDDLKAALAELASSYSGSERIEPHIRALYNTYCAHCGQIVSADAFSWEHGNPSPSTRTYSCPNCGDSGEHPCTPYDIELSSRFSSSGMHKARALERVISTTDQDRIHVEQALSVYIPRALYALITIINRIEGLRISTAGQKCLSALLLYAFDQSNVLWRPSSQKERRRQLGVPRRFWENNVWTALEEGVNIWSASPSGGTDHRIALTIWPELPPTTGGICMHEGRLATLVDSLKNVEINAVCTSIPRPNQAFWTLSALWAGWLWGRDAVGPFKSVLRRQRYDWAWHTSALSSVFKQLAAILKPATKLLGLICEAEPGFIGAALIAAGLSGCHLDNLAIRPDEDQAQILWSRANIPEQPQIGPALTSLAAQFARSYLEARAEPANYLNTLAASLIGITGSWESKKDSASVIHTKPTSLEKNIASTEPSEPTPSVIYASAYNSIREALSYRSGFLRYNLQDASNIDGAAKSQTVQTTLFSIDTQKSSAEADELEAPEISMVESETLAEKERPPRSSDISESTLLWLREYNESDQLPLTDRYELTLADFLYNHPGSTLQDVDRDLCEVYPGLFTPDAEFIRLCLESYSSPLHRESNQWSIRSEDNPMERQADLLHASQFLHQLGERLGFSSNDRLLNHTYPYISWVDKNGDQNYWFFPMKSATIGQIVLCAEQPPMKGYIVIPGSRANLLIYKLRRDPRLSRLFNPTQGYWRFLKFRHLRSLSDSPVLNRENLDQLLGLDPITYSTPQLWLI